MSLLREIDKSLVRFQGTLARASMNQQDAVDRLANKTANTFDKLRRNTMTGGIVRGSLAFAGAALTTVGALQKGIQIQNLPTQSVAARTVAVKEIEARAESWTALGRVCDTTAGFADTYFQAQRTGQEKVKELTQTEMSQQASARSAMVNVEQYANTLEQRFDSHKQSAKQLG